MSLKCTDFQFLWTLTSSHCGTFSDAVSESELDITWEFGNNFQMTQTVHVAQISRENTAKLRSI